MTVRLYLETNFLMSYATGRDPGTARLLLDCPAGIRRALPACCLMEVLANLEDERKRHNRKIDDYQTALKEAERSIDLPEARPMVIHLREVIVHSAAAFAAFRTRLFDAIDQLSAGHPVDLLTTGPGRYRSGFSISQILDPTDQLILTTILDDASDHPEDRKVFLTENKNCFWEDRDVRQALEAADIRYFQRAARFLQWYEAQAES